MKAEYRYFKNKNIYRKNTKDHLFVYRKHRLDWQQLAKGMPPEKHNVYKILPKDYVSITEEEAFLEIV
jgi:hypothetical protein